MSQQELGSMYDYLAKIILLGPSGCGKYVSRLNPSVSLRRETSGLVTVLGGFELGRLTLVGSVCGSRSCLLHRFVRGEC